MFKYKYLLSNSRKFHHPHLATELYKNNKLIKLVCGSPYSKIKTDIPKKFIITSFYINFIRTILTKNKLFNYFDNYLNILNSINIDKKASKWFKKADVFIGLSTTGLETGKIVKKNNSIYICERSSSHIVFQNKILSDEYRKLGLKYKPINDWFIERELQEYELADIILVPSTFVKNTFVKKKINKAIALEFGSSLNSFFKIKDLKKDNNNFNVLFVGQLSVRKGLHYLLDAFKKLKHSKKILHIVGSNTKDKDFFKKKINEINFQENIILHGYKNKSDINKLMNFCDVMVLPSIEEGQAIVTKEAISAGCPLIVSDNTGAKEFVEKNNCGITIPIQNSEIITDKLTYLADNKSLLEEYSYNAIKHSREHTWKNYLEELDSIIDNHIKK